MKIKKLSKNFLINLFVIVTIFSLDRISKLYVIYLYKKNFNSEIFTSEFLNIYLIWNEGIAFGLLSFSERHMYNLLTFLIFVLIIFIISMLKNSTSTVKYSLILILGGALGNLFDRLIYKAVPDFIDFHVGNFHWFIFNVADIFITLGVFFMIIIELNKKYKLS